MILQIGEVLKNSIEINELIPKRQLAKNSYVLLGVAQKNGERHIISSIVNSFTNEIEQVDVLYSINVKRIGCLEDQSFRQCPIISYQFHYQYIGSA